VHVATKVNWKHWIHTIVTCQKADDNCFLGQDRKEVIMVEFMQQRTTLNHNWVSKHYTNALRSSRTKGMQCWDPVLCFSMTMRVRIRVQLLAHERCWIIYTGSCLTTVLADLISFRATATCLAAWRTIWLRSGSFHNTDEFIEGVKTWQLTGGRLPSYSQRETCKIWGFHGGDCEEWCLLGCYAVWIL
jgi:hypothetical protein